MGRFQAVRLRSPKAVLDDWMYPRPPLATDEHELWSVMANRDQGGRAVGGRLYLTTDRVTFGPSRIEARLGGREWSADRRAVTDVRLTDRDLSQPLAGAWRRRLLLRVSGAEELFVVSAPEALAERMKADLDI